MIHKSTTRALLSFGVALAILLAIYLPTLQTIPNGSENYFMIDVGETQVVLNKWGTLHATGYPLFVMSGNAMVTLLRAFGIGAATAPSVVSLFWGMLTLTLMYMLAQHVTRRPVLVAALVVLFGLTRTMWIHNDIAEVYTMTLFFLPLLLAIALWQPSIRGRVYWLALIGGIAVAHHRALIMVAPALLVAVWDDLRALLRRRPAMLLALVGLGVLGLIPYGYLYLRGQSSSVWVYGEPGTFQGLLDQFMGKEADRFIGLPGSLDAVFTNVTLVNNVLLTDVTLPGVLVGILGLLLGLYTHRRAALVLIVSGAAAYLFHVFFYGDILSALILMVTFSLAFGWLFLGDWLLSIDALGVLGRGYRAGRPYVASFVLLIGALAFAVFQYSTNMPFIESLTSDTTGLRTIALAQHTPPGSTLMLAWGPRYFAVGFARDVLGLLPGVHLVDHKADYRAILQQGMLVTPAYTFYNQPISWWEEEIGAPVYLRAIEPDLVQIDTEPELEDEPGINISGVYETAHRIDCMSGKIILRVSWHSERTPERDLSVFVHLLDSSGDVIAQDDHSAPVYGWRPLTSWVPEEVLRDVYTLPRLPDAVSISYGLYEQRADGSFNNVVDYTLPVECGS